MGPGFTFDHWRLIQLVWGRVTPDQILLVHFVLVSCLGRELQVAPVGELVLSVFVKVAQPSRT